MLSLYGHMYHAVSQFVHYEVQSTLVTSTSVILNNRLSRRENLIFVLTQESNIR